jgi:hypothetical protein
MPVPFKDRTTVVIELVSSLYGRIISKKTCVL